MTRPLIVDEGRRRGAVAVAIFALGAMIASASVGIALGLLGHALVSLSTSTALFVIALAGLPLLVADLRGKTPTSRRQTRKMWRRKGPIAASLIWGLDLGVGFTTIRVASLYWMVALAVFLTQSLSTGALLGAYGIGLGTNLAAAVVFLGRREHVQYHPLHAAALMPLSRAALGAAIACWGVFLAVEAFS